MSKELGTLVVVVLKARNLKDKHSFYKQDVFAQISLNGPPKRTAVDVKGGQHPVWDEEIRISVPKDSSEKNRSLEVSCWAKERKTDDLLGQGKVDISETLRTGEFDDWVKLEIDGVYRGDLYLEMTFYANAPAPLNRRMSKLNPSDRLARPNRLYQYDNISSTPPPPTSSGSSPQRNPAQLPRISPKGNHLLPSAPRSASASPKSRNDVLPPLPEENSSPPSRSHIPPSLAAGPAAITGAKKPHVPSILRPGNLKSSPTPIVSSRSTPPEGSQPSQQYPPPPVSSGQPSSSYANTRPSPSVSFPVVLPSAHTPVYDLPPQYSFRPPQGHLTPEPDDDLPDPYLSARYQQPLPLPTGLNPSPPRQLPARRDPTAEAAEIRRQAALQDEQDRARKREQEEADAELARRLDRELNSGDLEDESARVHSSLMPGAW